MPLHRFVADWLKRNATTRHVPVYASGGYPYPDNDIAALSEEIRHFADLGFTHEATGGTLGIELHDVLANDNHAVALYTASGERAGKQQLNDNEVLIYHFRDGKVSEVWTHATDQYAADQFFL